jgi:hypothetical protein
MRPSVWRDMRKCAAVLDELSRTGGLRRRLLPHWGLRNPGEAFEAVGKDGTRVPICFGVPDKASADRIDEGRWSPGRSRAGTPGVRRLCPEVAEVGAPGKRTVGIRRWSSPG